ncbi:hypothetical protein [Psychroserpens sp. Hel_I_66]|nr:hypothetical protein [Psychroserpens sp. Hel_I_66]
MDFLNLITGKVGFMLLAMLALALFMFRKYKSERYFKDVEKRIKERQNKH